MLRNFICDVEFAMVVIPTHVWGGPNPTSSDVEGANGSAGRKVLEGRVE